MNIFALHDSPAIAAQQHCDKHVVKMVVEYCQLLSTAHRMLDGRPVTVQVTRKGKTKAKRILLLGSESAVTDDGKIVNGVCYAATHAGHPCAVWARRSSANYEWLVSLLEHLFAEYTLRYGRVHASAKYVSFLRNCPANIPRGARTPFEQCMPVQYQVPNDSIAAYHAFYLGDKIRFAKWTSRSIPQWFTTSIASKGLHASDFTRTRRLPARTPKGHRLLHQGAVAA